MVQSNHFLPDGTDNHVVTVYDQADFLEYDEYNLNTPTGTDGAITYFNHGSWTESVEGSATPEPATWSLLLMASALLIGTRQRWRRGTRDAPTITGWR